MDSAPLHPARSALGRSPLWLRQIRWQGALPALLFCLSLAAHGVLLKLPMPPPAETESPLPPEPEATTLAVVTLPASPLPTASAPPANAAPANTASPPANPSPTAARPPVQALDPTATPPPAPTAPAVATAEGEAPIVNPRDESPPPPGEGFPHPEGARTVECGGGYDCRAVPIPDGFHFLTWVNQFVDRLSNAGYAIKPLEDEYDEQGNRVYELTAPDGNKQYALFRSSGLTEASYVKVDTRAELNELYTTAWP